MLGVCVALLLSAGPGNHRHQDRTETWHNQTLLELNVTLILRGQMAQVKAIEVDQSFVAHVAHPVE